MRKCRYHNVCKLFSEDSLCCMNDNMARHYYGIHRAIGCYRSMMIKNE